MTAEEKELAELQAAMAMDDGPSLRLASIEVSDATCCAILDRLRLIWPHVEEPPMPASPRRLLYFTRSMTTIGTKIAADAPPPPPPPPAGGARCARMQPRCMCRCAAASAPPMPPPGSSRAAKAATEAEPPPPPAALEATSRYKFAVTGPKSLSAADMSFALQVWSVLYIYALDVQRGARATSASRRA